MNIFLNNRKLQLITLIFIISNSQFLLKSKCYLFFSLTKASWNLVPSSSLGWGGNVIDEKKGGKARKKKEKANLKKGEILL